MEKIRDQQWFDGLTIKTRDYAYTEWSESDTAVYARMLFDHQNDKAENINISENQKSKAIMNDLSLIMKKNRGKDFNSPLPGGKVIEHIMY